MCGKTNKNNQLCEICERDKTNILKNYSDKEVVAKSVYYQKGKDLVDSINPSLSIDEVSAIIEQLKERGSIDKKCYEMVKDEINKMSILKRMYGLSQENYSKSIESLISMINH